jgi:hypothetical protein
MPRRPLERLHEGSSPQAAQKAVEAFPAVVKAGAPLGRVYKKMVVPVAAQKAVEASTALTLGRPLVSLWPPRRQLKRPDGGGYWATH